MEVDESEFLSELDPWDSDHHQPTDLKLCCVQSRGERRGRRINPFCHPCAVARSL